MPRKQPPCLLLNQHHHWQMYDRQALQTAGYRVEVREQSAFPSAIEELQPVLILFCCYVIDKDVVDILSDLSREPVPVLVLAIYPPPESKHTDLLASIHIAEKPTPQVLLSLIEDVHLEI